MCMRVHMRVYLFSCFNINLSCNSSVVPCMRVCECVWVCAFVCLCVFVSLHVCVSVCLFVMSVCLCVCVSVCLCVCISPIIANTAGATLRQGIATLFEFAGMKFFCVEILY